MTKPAVSVAQARVRRHGGHEAIARKLLTGHPLDWCAGIVPTTGERRAMQTLRSWGCIEWDADGRTMLGLSAKGLEVFAEIVAQVAR